MNATVQSSLADYFHRTLKQIRRDPVLGPGSEPFNALVRTYLPIVYGTALKLLPERPEAAAQIAQATFECLAVNWRRQLKGGSVGHWLALTAVWLLRASVSVSLRERKRLGFSKPARGSSAAEHLLLFKHLFQLRPKAQTCVVLFHVLQAPPIEFPGSSRMAGFQKTAAKSIAWLSRKLRKTTLGANVISALASLSVVVPPEIESALLDSFTEWKQAAPLTPLTRATLISWRWLAVRKFFKRVLATVGVIVCVLAALAGTFIFLAQRGHLNTIFLKLGSRDILKEFPELAKPARSWPVTAEDKALVRQELPRTAADLYQPTNIWTAKLSFTHEQWKAVQPENIPPVPNMFNGGRIILRNPKAQRSGLSGVIGLDFNWVEAQFEFAGAKFQNVAARYRGNGTFVQSLYGPKQSFKVDLNKFTKKQSLAGIDELNFVNSIPDSSYVRDAMAQAVFRELGVPAPRTAYAYLSVDVARKWTNQALGLYCLIENIDKHFAEDRFDTKKVPIFKPVTYDLFIDLGTEYNDYAEIYDLKTDATPEQLQRIVDFSRVVSHASDEEFAQRLPGFLDLDQFAAFIAGHVLLSSYDGFFANGQNFFMYLHPRSEKFGFISWDQDHSWGEFGYIGTAVEREQASIWKPWVRHYDFKFLKRTMEVPAFREVYRRKLESALETIFTKDRLYAQIDQLAATIRPAVTAESEFRLKRFDQSVSSEWLPGPRDGTAEGPKAPVHQIKRFIENRIISIREQLDGKSEGVRLGRR